MNNLVTKSKYESYKYSGEQWMESVPKHWEIKKLKHLFFEKPHTFNQNLNSGSISFGEVVPKDDEKIPILTKASYQEVLKGEFLINPLNLNYDLKSLRIALSEMDVVVSAGYIVLKDKGEIVRQYFKYLLHRYDVAFMKLLGSGVRQTINFGHIANSLLVLPSKKEQITIANYLDKKTTQVDEAIAIKEKQIELLKERKQILIQNAVTRGLDPSVPMKDSGVEWIGEIPQHWEIKRIKHVAGNFMYGTSVDCNELEVGTPVLRIPNIDERIISFDDLKYASLGKDETQRYKLAENDILIIRTNGNPKLVGKSAIFKESNEYLFASYLIKIQSKKNIHPEFFLESMNSFSIRSSLSHSARTSVGNYNLNTQSLANTSIALPSINEQINIVEYLNREFSLFDKAFSSAFTQIQKLKEYKATLINSAVTGKIKVPGVEV